MLFLGDVGDHDVPAVAHEGFAGHGFAFFLGVGAVLPAALGRFLLTGANGFERKTDAEL